MYTVVSTDKIKRNFEIVRPSLSIAPLCFEQYGTREQAKFHNFIYLSGGGGGGTGDGTGDSGTGTRSDWVFSISSL